MKHPIYLFLSAICVAFIFFSCKPGRSDAELALAKAREMYREKDYSGAKQAIDSLKVLYSKAFDEIRAGLALLDSVRRGENELNISVSDSLIGRMSVSVDSLKKMFVYARDKRYDDIGTYYPKETYSAGVPSTGLRSGVDEKGKMFIESVFVGGSARHNILTVSAKNGLKAQTLAENGDGLNYSFQNSGARFEIIRFSGTTDNGVAKFIAENQDQPLTITLGGRNTNSYSLSPAMKKGILKSYLLSTWIGQVDSLTSEKEKAMFRLEYLNGKK